MSLLSAAAADEDGDIIQALRAENDALKQQLMAATNSALDHVQRNRDLESLLEAVGAGGVGPLMAPSSASQSGGIPPDWKPVEEHSQAQHEPPIAHLHLDQWMQLKLVQTTPPPPGAFPVYAKQQSTRQPLTDEQWLKLWTGKTGQRLKPGLDRDRLLRRFRFAERAHGIGGEA